MRAAIYTRVSSDGQEENTSLETQDVACRQYAVERGFDVQMIYRDVHSGFELWERPQVRAMLEAIRRREIDAVIVYALDRLSRKQVHTAILVDECERAGVELLFVTETFEKTAIGEFLRSAKAFAAELEREKIKERTMRGRLARMERGKLPVGARPLYGYRWRDEDKSGYEIDEATAPTVRRIFTEAVTGTGLRTIAARLNAEAIPSPNGHALWSHAMIGRILKHDAYTGNAVGHRWKGERRKTSASYRYIPRAEEERIQLPAGTIPPLISQEDFALVREQLERNKAAAARNNPRPEAFLLRAGFLRCGYCGKAIVCGWRDTATGGRSSMPVYRNQNDHRGCPKFGMDAPTLDAIVWGHIEAVLTRPEIVAAEVARLRQDDPTVADLSGLDRQCAAVGRKIANLTRTIAGVDDDDTRAALVGELTALGTHRRQLEEERAAVLARRDAWHAVQGQLDSVEDWCRQVAANLGDLTYEQKRQALTALEVRVRLYRADHDPRYEITAALPLEISTATPVLVERTTGTACPPTGGRGP
ncbi:MAG: recombinase family protein [Chloroflexota bacterium]|nr:recombinase family protein [Chloroflexota bacterium]